MKITYDADDRLIAIEVLDASSRVDGVDTVQLRVMLKPVTGQPDSAE